VEKGARGARRGMKEAEYRDKKVANTEINLKGYRN